MLGLLLALLALLALRTRLVTGVVFVVVVVVVVVVKDALHEVLFMVGLLCIPQVNGSARVEWSVGGLDSP